MKTVLFTLVNGEGVIARVNHIVDPGRDYIEVFDPHYLRMSDKAVGFQPVAIFSEPGVKHKLLLASVSVITESFDPKLEETFLNVVEPNRIVVPDKKIILS